MPLLNKETLHQLVKETYLDSQKRTSHKFVRQRDNIAFGDANTSTHVLLQSELINAGYKDSLDDAGILSIDVLDEPEVFVTGFSLSLKLKITPIKREETANIVQKYADELKTDDFAVAVNFNI